MRKQRVVRNRIPADILENVALNRAIGRLPPNYNFEIHKTVWRVREVRAATKIVLLAGWCCALELVCSTRY